MKWILLLSLLSFSWAQADGHSVGNGGGVICIKGQCKTLIEAGLEVKPEYQGVWLPTGDLIQRVHAGLQKLAFHESIKKKLAVRILGRLDQFRKAEIVDPNKLELIKHQYIDLAEDAGFVIDPATFELVAFSSDDTMTPAMTYILPKFFELNPDQQADILIHEGLYRGQPTSDLRYVLQFEHAAREYAFKRISDKVNLQVAAYHLRVINKAQLLGHLLLTTPYWDPTFGLPQPTVQVEKYGDVLWGDDLKGTFAFDLNRVLKVGELEPRMPYILSKTDKLKLKYLNNYRWANPYGARDFITLDDNGSLIFIEAGGSVDRTYVVEGVESLDLVLPD